MKKLNLRNLKHEYIKVNKGKREVYFDKENNNLIVFEPIDKQCDTYTICNGIAHDAYDDLIEQLNEYVNTIVYWSQISNTTSDYSIYMDWNLNPSVLIEKSVDEIIDELNSLVLSERKSQYKYTFVLDGTESVIKFDRKEVTDNKRKGKYIDHINCDKWDNRIENLRLI